MQRLDFYVTVVDNYGDMGFALNLALSLRAKHPDLRIRFFSDDRGLFDRLSRQLSVDFIEYIDLAEFEKYTPSELIFNFFDRPIPEAYLSRCSFPKTIIQFGYFLLHSWVESLHGTEYILPGGHDRVIHFIPSLLSGTGGVIINPEVERRKAKLSKLSKAEARKQFLLNRHPDPAIQDSGSTFFKKNMEDSEINSEWRLFDVYEKNWVSVFVYPETIESVLEAISHADENAVFFISGGDFNLQGRTHNNIVWMPFLSIEDYGVFQSLCDANIVRGENSLCQGLISGKPVLWDIYKEKNGAHGEKIEDFLGFLRQFFSKDTFDEYARIFREFNGGAKDIALLDFLEWVEEFGPEFKKIGEYVRKECGLVEQIETILRI